MPQAEHLDAPLVLADRVPHVSRRRARRPPRNDADEGRVAEREPVEVLRVEDPDEGLRHPLEVIAEPFLAARPAARVLLDEDRARLRERERDHRECDPADAQGHRAEHDRQDETDGGRERDRRPEAPVPSRDRDVAHVDADREVERVSERQQPGEPEEQVVRQREAGEDEADRQQLEHTRRVERTVEDLAEPEPVLRHERERENDSRRDGQPRHASHVAALPDSPPGRISSTIASSSTTERSPRPDDA